MTDGGARLRVDGLLGVRDRVDLLIEQDGTEAECEVVWRNRNEVGVRFLGPLRPTRPASR